MSNNEPEKYLVDLDGAKKLYDDLRDRIPPPVDPSIVIDDSSTSATDKAWSVAKTTEELNKKAPIVIDSKSGNPIVIDDGVPGLKLYGMKVSFLPKQEGSGDPSPTNIRPITGWTGINIGRTGENMLPLTNMNQNIYNVSEDGTVSNKSASQGYGWLNYAYRVFDVYLPAGTYTLVFVEVEEPTITGSGATICDENGSWIIDLSGKTGTTRKVSFTLSAGKRIGVVVKCMDGAYKIAIAPGSSGDYSQYTGTTIPISWQTEAGTVYGGELDVLTGVLTIEYVEKHSTWGEAKVGNPDATTGYQWAYLWYDDPIVINGQGATAQNSFCNVGVMYWSGTEIEYGHFYLVYASAQNKYRANVILHSSTPDNTPIQVVTKLQTPVTVQLDAHQIELLTGVNTIYSDANTMEIAYPIDTKKYVDLRGSKVKDIRWGVNGSIVDENGIVKFDGSYTYGVGFNSVSGLLYVSGSDLATIKAGVSGYRPIVPSHLHEAIFYGLAKLAGVDLASSSTPVGTFTEPALVAIQKMLGVYQAPWELIREDSFTNAESADVTINTDDYGNSFELTAIRLLVWTPSQETAAVIGSWGEVVFSKSGISIMSSNISNAQTRTVNPSDSRIIGHISIENEGGMAKLTEYRYATLNGEPNITMKAYMDSSLGYYPFRLANDFAIDKIRIKSITGTISVRLYGKRKWT